MPRDTPDTDNSAFNRLNLVKMTIENFQRKGIE